MVKKLIKTTEKKKVFRGCINLYEYEIDYILNVLRKDKSDTAKDIIRHLKKVKESEDAE